jgi:ribosome-binding protein aMBF1 (putative translation factor)
MDYLENIQKAIKDSGLKKKFIAKELKIQYDTFRRKLKGETDFKISELVDLCSLLKIDIMEVFRK